MIVEPPAGARAGVMRLTPGLVPAFLEALGSDFAVDLDLLREAISLIIHSSASGQ
jgi:hypothetical protein